MARWWKDRGAQDLLPTFFSVKMHEELDRQVRAEYRLPESIPDDQLLAELLKLNQERARG